MVSVPILLGTFAPQQSPLKWQQFTLLVFWFLGYFAYFAGTIYLKTHFRRALRPFLSYSVFSIIFGIFTLWGNWYLLLWIPVFIPLLLISFWATYSHHERSFGNDLVTVIATSLMLPVAFQLGNPQFTITTFPSIVWISTIAIASYFIGTIFYVKTNIRERNSNIWLIFSFLFHIFCGSLMCYIAVSIPEFNSVSVSISVILRWIFILIWLVITIRAILVPLYGRIHGYFSAKVIGIGEFALTLFIFGTLFFILRFSC